MKKNRIILFIVLGVSSSLIMSCKQNDGLIHIALDLEDEGRYDELFAGFHEKTGQTVIATYGIDPSKLIGTKDEPDILKTSTVVVRSMKESLLDLSPFISLDGEFGTDIYIDSIMDALTIDGKVYGLPSSINTSLLYYNKTLFDASEVKIRAALGLAETDSVYPQDDWTYDDYQKAGVAISLYTGAEPNLTYTRFGAEAQLNWWGEWLVYLNQMGGSFYKPGTDNRVCNLDTPEALAATEFFVSKSMGDAGHKFAPNAVESASSFSFYGGNVAMIFGGHMGDWFSYDALGIDWDIQELPTPVGLTDARGGEISSDAFAVSARSKKAEEAFGFLKMLTGEEGVSIMYRYGKIGALKSMEDIIAGLPSEYQKDINISALFKAVDKAVTLPDEEYFSVVMRERVMSELYKLFITGRGAETDVQAVLLRIKEDVDRFYATKYGA